MEILARSGDFCPNTACQNYGKLQRDQAQAKLKKIGKTPCGVQRCPCKTCGKAFTETTGTLFYRKHADEHEILEVLVLLAEGNRISTLTGVKGIKEDTTLRWLREATRHADELEAVLMKDFRHKRAQLNGLWSFVRNQGKKSYSETAESGTFWNSTLLDVDSRRRVARGIVKDETQASLKVFQTLQQRGHPESPPPLISDGWGGIDDAMVAVYGLVPQCSGRGRPPTHPPPGEDWLYLQADAL